MDFGLIASIFVALAAYRVAAPVLDRIANRIWGNPHSAAIVAGSAACAGVGHIQGGTPKAAG